MTVSAIIPAYNEEARIRNVIEPLIQHPLVTDIIVVDDGSKDGTSLVVKGYSRVKLIQLTENKGKAAAIKEGLRHCSGEIIFLLDADLIGLNHEHIDAMIRPLFQGSIEMTIGIFQSGRLITNLAQKIAPNLSGQRAFKNILIEDIMNLKMKGYGSEVAISQYIRENKIQSKHVLLKDISHVMKEEKLGLSKGLVWRLKMYKDIVKYWFN